MLTPQSRPSRNASGNENLFVEADPEQEALSSARAERRSRQASAARRELGEVAAWSSRSDPPRPRLSAARRRPGSPAQAAASANCPQAWA